MITKKMIFLRSTTLILSLLGLNIVSMDLAERKTFTFQNIRDTEVKKENVYDIQKIHHYNQDAIILKLQNENTRIITRQHLDRTSHLLVIPRHHLGSIINQLERNNTQFLPIDVKVKERTAKPLGINISHTVFSQMKQIPHYNGKEKPTRKIRVWEHQNGIGEEPAVVYPVMYENSMYLYAKQKDYLFEIDSDVLSVLKTRYDSKNTILDSINLTMIFEEQPGFWQSKKAFYNLTFTQLCLEQMKQFFENRKAEWNQTVRNIFFSCVAAVICAAGFYYFKSK